MIQLPYTDSVYRTAAKRVSLLARLFPTATFYARFLAIVLRDGARAKRGKYGSAQWCQGSFDVLRALEKVGVRFEVTGIEHVQRPETPCVVIGNHVSLLETAVLPVIIRPIRRVTFVVKQSLTTYPVFGHVMRARDPIAVSQTNPRQDLKTVLTGGADRLQRGVSVIVFPQGRRRRSFDPAEFNTLGVKLAQRAGVPVVPLALMTDAWENGKYLKDFGRIVPSRAVHFAFGEPMRIEGRGTEQHQAIIEFIRGKLNDWKGEEREG